MKNETEINWRTFPSLGFVNSFVKIILAACINSLVKHSLSADSLSHDWMVCGTFSDASLK